LFPQSAIFLSLKDGGYFSAGMEASWSAHQIEYIGSSRCYTAGDLVDSAAPSSSSSWRTNKQNRQRKTKRKKNPK
jgi:hypothetical protein